MISREGHYIQPISARSEHNAAHLNYSRIKAGWDDQNLKLQHESFYITVYIIIYIFLNILNV